MEAVACGVGVGLEARSARIRCPEARLLDVDLDRCRLAFEEYLQVLEQFSPHVEPHGWDAAYVDLGDAVDDRSRAVPICQESGRAVRKALGDSLQPALGWDQGKFTAQTAARCTRPGRLLAVDAAREHSFLGPLPISLLPLPQDALQRLRFLGLRTLGQYAALPVAAVWQQFGRAGKHAHRLARGQDDRPVVPRWQSPVLVASHDFEIPVTERQRLLAAVQRRLEQLLDDLSGGLKACGQVRLALRFEDGSVAERTRTFLFPTADLGAILRALDDLLDRIDWPASAGGLTIALERIQDTVMEQLMLFDRDEQRQEMAQVQRYLCARFGTSRLLRAALVQPNAPLPEWRVGWQDQEVDVM